MSAPREIAVPGWVPPDDLPGIDVSELAPEVPGLHEQCGRLGLLLGANVAAYRRDARGQPEGLCSRYRAARLGSTELAELTGTEQMFPDVAFVAYARPLEPL